jgi:cytochrome c biogenesis protein CcdA
MTGILITFDFASMFFLAWVFLRGYQIGEVVSMRSHIVSALAATGLSVFSHCMTLMYFAATGRMIREAVEKADLDRKYVDQTKGYRKQVFRLGLLAVLVVMANTILGGGAHTKVFPIQVHEYLSIGTLLFNLFAVIVEVRCLIANHLLGHRVSELYSAKSQ